MGNLKLGNVLSRYCTPMNQSNGESVKPGSRLPGSQFPMMPFGLQLIDDGFLGI